MNISEDLVREIQNDPYASVKAMNAGISPNATAPDGSTLYEIAMEAHAAIAEREGLQISSLLGHVYGPIRRGGVPTERVRESMRRILPVLNLEPFYDEPDKYRWQELLNDWLTVGKACRLLELAPFAPYSEPPALEFRLNERWPEPPLAPEEFYTRPVVVAPSPFRDREFGDTEWRDDEREKIGTKAFRELSDELSPKMVEGFDLESLEVSKQLQKTFFRPLKNFKLHKDEALRRMSSVTAALCIYGELDRAANGVRPL